MLALTSGGLFLLTLPCTTFIAEHESLGGYWVWAGIITAVLATFAMHWEPRDDGCRVY